MLVDKSKIIVMKIDKVFLRRVILVLEFGCDVNVNVVLKRVCLSLKVI